MSQEQVPSKQNGCECGKPKNHCDPCSTEMRSSNLVVELRELHRVGNKYKRAISITPDQALLYAVEIERLQRENAELEEITRCQGRWIAEFGTPQNVPSGPSALGNARAIDERSDDGRIETTEGLPHEPSADQKARTAFEKHTANWSTVTPWDELSQETRQYWRDHVANSTPEPPDAVREAALALVSKLKQIEDHPDFQSVWVLAANRGMPYRGPNYAGELQSLKQALGLYPTATKSAPYVMKPSEEAVFSRVHKSHAVDGGRLADETSPTKGAE
jgi:hypothetical protein